MSKYFLLSLALIGAMTSPTLASVPPSQAQEDYVKAGMQLCEETDGVATEEYHGGYDEETGADLALAVSFDCECPEDTFWDASKGCIASVVSTPKPEDNVPSEEPNKSLYASITTIALIALVLILWKKYKK